MKAPESSLPIITIAPYLPSDSIAPPGKTSTPCREPVTREQVARAVHLACRDVGFFYLDVESFIRLDEMREVLDLGRDFFSLPGGDKEEIGLEKSDGIRGTFTGTTRLLSAVPSTTTKVARSVTDAYTCRISEAQPECNAGQGRSSRRHRFLRLKPL